MANRLAREAEIELDEIWYRIGRETGNVAAADSTIDMISDRFVLLAGQPYLGRIRSDLRLGLRSHAVGNYVVFYRTDDPDIVILHVLHGRRDIAALLG